MIRILTLSFASAALLNLSVRVPAGGYLALVALVPLLWALRAQHDWWRGSAATLIASLGIVVPAFEGALVAVAWLFPVLIGTQALWYAVPGAVYVLARRAIGPVVAMGMFPFLWLAPEYLAAQRWIWSDLANGLSRMGYTQYDTIFRGAATWSSVSAVSLVAVLINVAVYFVIRERRWGPALGAMVLPVLMIVPFAWTTATGESLSTVAIQGSVTTREVLMGRFDDVAARAMLEPYRLLTERAAAGSPDLIVWPETNLPQPVVDGAPAWYVRDALASAEVGLVGGISQRAGRTFNAMFVWDDGLTEVYRKRSLIPSIESHYTRGSTLPPVQIAGMALGLGICLDTLYPTFSRDYVLGGAEALVVVTNDNFGLGTVTPELHLRASTFRAIETGRAMVYVGQSGPSAFVTHTGALVSRTREGETVALQGVLQGRSGSTPYVRFGDSVGAFSVLVTMFTVLFSLVAVRVEDRAGLSPLR